MLKVLLGLLSVFMKASASRLVLKGLEIAGLPLCRIWIFYFPEGNWRNDAIVCPQIVKMCKKHAKTGGGT